MSLTPCRTTMRLMALLLAFVTLAACAPPPELAGRPPSPADVAAVSLLPPGKTERFEWPSSSDGAEVTTSGGAHFRAVRFPSAVAAGHGFLRTRETIPMRSDVTSNTSVDAGALKYVRYRGEGVSGLIWVSGTWLFGAEARDQAALEKLIQASRAGGVGDPGLAGSLPSMVALFGLATVALIFLIWLLVRLIVRGLAVRPAAGTPALNRQQLVQQLLALNDPERPWIVRPGPEADLVAEWKYADARWWGVLGKAGVKKAYRLRLYFDEARHQCGALDEFGEIDWSAGLLSAPGVHFSQSFFRGIQLVKKERGVAYGFKTPTGGGAGKVLDYAFDIDEVKQPVIDAVVASGWTYQPIVWPGRKGRE